MNKTFNPASTPSPTACPTAELLANIRKNVIGEGQRLNTPFGEKPLIYADYTASGRSLNFIEDYLREQVLPFYANTHSESSATGRQTTAFREQARRAIARSVNANEAEYAVLFTGAGATAAINKTIDILGIRASKANVSHQQNIKLLSTQEPMQESMKQPIEEKSDLPVIFIGPYEHHSNELPWRETQAERVTIPLTHEGRLDLDFLQAQLEAFAHRPLKIASFSAASNVTGLKTPVSEVCALLKRYGALSFWDYAAAAPYVAINLAENPLDGVFISPHKFIGGPGTPGVLVIKRALLNNPVPAMPGGGTVSWVNPETHYYLAPGERREEGGTPAIVESIRAGLVFQLKDQVGSHTIEALEQGFIRRALSRLAKHPNIEILGPEDAERIAILSLQIRCAGKYLHHGLIVALLNDLFGIQARGGCSCAGPYGHQLLNIDSAQSHEYLAALKRGESILKPGWLRLNFNYFIDEATFDYLLCAIELVATYGWKMLRHYHFNTEQGVWVANGYQAPPPQNIVSLSTFVNPPGVKSSRAKFSTEATNPTPTEKHFRELLQQAESILCQPPLPAGKHLPKLSPQGEALRWFALPGDIQNINPQSPPGNNPKLNKQSP